VSRVLLVDDDESQRLSLGILLEDEGFVVEVAVSFAAARRLIEAPAAAYDAVILDQHLGDGVGSALVPLVRERLPRAATVLVSGSLEERELTDAASDAVIPKGTHFPDLLAALQEVIARAARR
jgi:two-component system response regulator RegA